MNLLGLRIEPTRFKPSWVYKSYDEVINKLFEIDSGHQEINPKTWKILEERYR